MIGVAGVPSSLIAANKSWEEQTTQFTLPEGIASYQALDVFDGSRVASGDGGQAKPLTVAFDGYGVEMLAITCDIE